MVDCSQRGANADVLKRFGVRAFPTVLFLDPRGNKVEDLRARDPASVKRQIETVAATHGAKLFLDLDLGEAQKSAKEDGKLLAVVYMDKDSRSTARNDALRDYLLSDEMDDIRERFVWVRRPLDGEDGKRTEDARELGANRSPTLVILDPAGEREVLNRSTAFRGLKRTLERLLNQHAKQ